MDQSLWLQYAGGLWMAGAYLTRIEQDCVTSQQENVTDSRTLICRRIACDNVV